MKDRTPGRLAATVTALRRDLGSGPLLSRYSGDDGLRGAEGAFLCRSFWLADALARIGRLDEATATMTVTSSSFGWRLERSSGSCT